MADSRGITAQRLLERMDEVGCSQSDLAAAINISQAAISDILPSRADHRERASVAVLSHSPDDDRTAAGDCLKAGGGAERITLHAAPAMRAVALLLWRIDADQPHLFTAEPNRVSIGYTDGTAQLDGSRECGGGGDKEQDHDVGHITIIIRTIKK